MKKFFTSKLVLVLMALCVVLMVLEFGFDFNIIVPLFFLCATIAPVITPIMFFILGLVVLARVVDIVKTFLEMRKK